MDTGLDDQIDPYRIQDAPPSMFYIPNFISEDEEAYILNKIPDNKWISLSHRRLQAIPARLTESNALVASSGLPDWLKKPAVERLDNLGIFKDSPHKTVNHCLVNEYLPGQGIMPHEDGAAYYPVVATVSLSGSIVLDITEKADQQATQNEVKGSERVKKTWRILQEPRSLLVTSGPAYKDTLHGIADISDDVDLNEGTVANWPLLGNRETFIASGSRNVRTTRISLTYRDVLKESKLSAKIFGKPKT